MEKHRENNAECVGQDIGSEFQHLFCAKHELIKVQLNLRTYKERSEE